MKKANLFLAALALLLFANFIIACRKDIAEVIDLQGKTTSADFTSFAEDEIMAEVTDQTRVLMLLKSIFEAKSDGVLDESELSSLGNPQTDPNLLAALFISEHYSQNEILWKEDEVLETNVPADSLPATDRATKYKWTGGAHKYGFCGILWKKKWPAMYNVQFVSNCQNMYYGPTYVCCSTLTCPPYPSECQ